MYNAELYKRLVLLTGCAEQIDKERGFIITIYSSGQWQWTQYYSQHSATFPRNYISSAPEVDWANWPLCPSTSDEKPPPRL